MKKYKRKILCISMIFLILLISPMVSFAHSGRTDSRGENKDNNKIGSDFKIDIKRIFHLY